MKDLDEITIEIRENTHDNEHTNIHKRFTRQGERI